MKKKYFVVAGLFFSFFSVFSAFAQNRASSKDSAAKTDKKAASVRVDGKELPPVLYINPSPEKLPAGYRSVVLGMDFEAAKDALKKDIVFGYRGERDVSLLPENRILIETATDAYLQRCWFQFYENKLYTIIVNFNPEKMDFYSVFTKLLEKYGEPAVLSPETIQWQNDEVLLSLERPVSVKYIDRKVFDSLAEKSGTEKTAAETIRTGVLDAL